MDRMSPPSRSGMPLADVTNIHQRGDVTGDVQEMQDSIVRKRQRDKTHYATMSREKKDENNRKQRERRRNKKALTIGVSVPVDEGEDNECLHRGQLTQDNDLLGSSDVSVPVDEYEDNEWLHRGQLTQDNDLPAMDGDENDECLNMGQFTKCNYQTGPGGFYQENDQTAGGEVLSNSIDTNVDGIHDNCIDTNNDGGRDDEPITVEDQTISPGERRRRNYKARYAAMSPVAKEALLKKRCDKRVAKRLFQTPQEKKEVSRQFKANYKRMIKEHRANNLHPHSITMTNPQWKPELISPSGDEPASRISEQMVIPEYGGRPVYVEVKVQEPPQEVGSSETFLSNTIHKNHLTPGLRSSQRKHCNQEFEATIGRNTQGTTSDNDNFVSHLTQSCVIDNGITQTDPLGDRIVISSDAGVAGTSKQAVDHERTTQIQPSDVEDGDENIVFEEDEEKDEGYLFAGQGKIKCSIIFCMGWCFDSAWFVSI